MAVVLCPHRATADAQSEPPPLQGRAMPEIPIIEMHRWHPVFARLGVQRDGVRRNPIPQIAAITAIAVVMGRLNGT